MGKLKELKSEIMEILAIVSPKNRLYILLFAIFNSLIMITYFLFIHFTSVFEAEIAEDEAKRLGIKLSELPTELQDSSFVDTSFSDNNESLFDDLLSNLQENKSSNTSFSHITSEDLAAYKELISLFSDREMYRKSLKHIERVANYLSDDIVFQAQAGKAYIKAGKPQQAIPYLQKAISKFPKDIGLQLDLARATFALNSPLEAIALLKNLHQKFPGEVKVKIDLASSLAEIEPNSKEADSLFKQLKKEHPKSPMIWYQSARQKMNQGNFNSSRKELTKALKLDPLDHRVHARMGMAQYYLQQYDFAKKHYRTALSMNPEDYNTWYNLGELKYTLANRSQRVDSLKAYSHEALSHFLQALSLEKDYPKAHYRVGLLLNSNKQFKEAIQHLKKTLEKNPDHISSLVAIAIALEATGHKELALENLERAYYLDPFNRVVANKLKRFKG